MGKESTNQVKLDHFLHFYPTASYGVALFRPIFRALIDFFFFPSLHFNVDDCVLALFKTSDREAREKASFHVYISE